MPFEIISATIPLMRSGRDHYMGKFDFRKTTQIRMGSLKQSRGLDDQPRSNLPGRKRDAILWAYEEPVLPKLGQQQSNTEDQTEQDRAPERLDRPAAESFLPVLSCNIVQWASVLWAINTDAPMESPPYSTCA